MAKRNQPTLYEDVSLFFQDPLLIASISGPPAPATKLIGVWNIAVSWPPTNSMTRGARDWLGIGQVISLRRRVEHALKRIQEIVYGITSLIPQVADPACLLELTQRQAAM